MQRLGSESAGEDHTIAGGARISGRERIIEIEDGRLVKGEVALKRDVVVGAVVGVQEDPGRPVRREDAPHRGVRRVDVARVRGEDGVGQERDPFDAGDRNGIIRVG